MKTERIKEIQATTPYPDSVSIAQALLQVWNETAQDYKQSIIGLIDELRANITILCISGGGKKN